MQKSYQIYDLFCCDKKLIILLLDPDKFHSETTKLYLSQNNDLFDLIFVGGSLLSARQTNEVVLFLRSFCKTPIVLFPGNSMQICDEANAILFLSLISGRNPEYLIGQHIHAAPILARSNIEIIPTSYILIDGGNRTSVEYISQTMPIPANKPDITAATALAGKYLGHKLIYLEAGSGALNAIPVEIVKRVALDTKLPIIVGGGIKTTETALNILNAGAKAIVIGSLFEKDPKAVIDIAQKIKS